MKTALLLPVLYCSLALALARADSPYFPVKANAADGITAFEAQWYGKSLQRMNEPRLPASVSDPDAQIYRVMVLPTWGNSIVVRAEKHGKTYRLSARRLDGQAGYDPGRLVESKEVDLDNADSTTLEVLIYNLHFFQMPIRDDVIGFDGSEWILEGVAHGKYHVVARWSATSYGPDKRRLTNFLALYRFLLDKSELSQRPSNRGHKLM
jgi:hypothetical protein